MRLFKPYSWPLGTVLTAVAVVCWLIRREPSLLFIAALGAMTIGSAVEQLLRGRP